MTWICYVHELSGDSRAGCPECRKELTESERFEMYALAQLFPVKRRNL